MNVFAGAFDVIVEPRLTDPKAWYLMADPYAVDSLYYAYLEGNEGLRVDSTEEFKPTPWTMPSVAISVLRRSTIVAS